MSKADFSTTTIRSRRAVLAGVASAAALPIVAALPTAARALASVPSLNMTTPHADAELLALADQYVVAYKKYSELNLAIDRMEGAARSGRLPRGYRKAERERDSAERAYRRIEERIAETRANTLQGMLAKVRCAQAYSESEDPFDFAEGGCPEVMARSIFRDVMLNSAAAA